jgi:polar amino acid transport system substrate-binding protein
MPVRPLLLAVRHRWLVLASLLGAHAAYGADPQLSITAELSPPSSMLVDGKLSGFATEKVRALMARSSIGYSINVYPWKRAYTLALTKADTCVYSTTRQPDREQLFKWVGPTHENDWTLFALAARNIKLTTIEDARTLRIGAYNGDVRSEYLLAHGYKVDAVQDRLSNPRKLMLGRIDLWVTSLRVGHATIAQHGWSGQIVPVLTFNRTQLYLACNPSVPDALIATMNARLQGMKLDGTSAAIEHKFDVIRR